MKSKLKCLYRNVKYRLGIQDVDWDTEALLLRFGDNPCEEITDLFGSAVSVTLVDNPVTAYYGNEYIVNLVYNGGSFISKSMWDIPKRLIKTAVVVPKRNLTYKEEYSLEVITLTVLPTATRTVEELTKEFKKFESAFPGVQVFEEGEGTWVFHIEPMERPVEVRHALDYFRKDVEVSCVY